MAEDVVLRLRAENEDLKRKLEESQAEVRSLRGEVEQIGPAGAASGDQIEEMASEVREDFSRTREEIDQAQAKLDEYAGATDQAGDSTEEFGKKTKTSSEQLSDATEVLGKAAILMAGLRTASELLSESLESLVDDTEGVADAQERLAQITDELTTPLGLIESLLRSQVDVLDPLRKGYELLGDRVANLVAAQALETAGLDEAAARARAAADDFGKLAEQEEKAADRAEDLAAAADRLREEVRPSGEQILTDLRALRQIYGELEEGNQLTTEQLIRLGKEAERLLGVFELIGKEAPADLQELADRARQAAEAKKVAAKAAEDLAAKEKGLAESTVEAADSQEQLATALEEKTAAAAEAAREQLEALQETLDKTSERIGELAQEAADSAREAQQQATQQVQPGQPTRQSGGSDAEQQVQSLRQEIADLNEEQQQGLIVTEEGTQRLFDARTELIEAERDLKDEAAGTGQVFYRSAQQAAASQEKVNDLIQGAREQVAQLSQQLEDPAAASSLQRIVDSFDAVTSQVGVTDSEIQAFAENFQTEVDRLREQATTSFDETAKGAEKGKEGVEKLGDAAKDATKSADELGKSTKTATDHAKELADVEIENLPASIDKATAAAQEHLALLDQILAKWAEISAVIAATG